MVIRALQFMVAVLLVAAPTSWFIAEYLIRETPVPTQIMLVDVAQVIGDGTKTTTAGGKSDVSANTAALKRIVDEAAERGIIVLDADAVIKAPPEAYITLTKN